MQSDARRLLTGGSERIAIWWWQF